LLNLTRREAPGYYQSPALRVLNDRNLFQFGASEIGSVTEREAGQNTNSAERVRAI